MDEVKLISRQIAETRVEIAVCNRLKNNGVMMRLGKPVDDLLVAYEMKLVELETQLNDLSRNPNSAHAARKPDTSVTAKSPASDSIASPSSPPKSAPPIPETLEEVEVSTQIIKEQTWDKIRKAKDAHAFSIVLLHAVEEKIFGGGVLKKLFRMRNYDKERGMAQCALETAQSNAFNCFIISREVIRHDLKDTIDILDSANEITNAAIEIINASIVDPGVGAGSLDEQFIAGMKAVTEDLMGKDEMTGKASSLISLALARLCSAPSLEISFILYQRLVATCHCASAFITICDGLDAKREGKEFSFQEYNNAIIVYKDSLEKSLRS